jgi:signal peptidase I
VVSNITDASEAAPEGAVGDYLDIKVLLSDGGAENPKSETEGIDDGAETTEEAEGPETAAPGDEGGDGEKIAVNKLRVEVYDWLQCLVSTMLAVVLAFIFIGRQISVDGDSMFQTLHDDDRVLMTNVFYKPEYGDIVIIKTESFGETPLVKRIIATEGQEINIDFAAHIVTVDGAALDEPYINEPTSVEGDFRGPVKVPEGCVFVMGDNRNRSTDSRTSRVGFVDVRNILGKVHLITIPGKDSDYGLRDWSRIGSVYKTTP